MSEGVIKSTMQADPKRRESKSEYLSQVCLQVMPSARLVALIAPLGVEAFTVPRLHQA